MSTMAKGTPYPTNRDLVMLLLGLPNMLDLNNEQCPFNYEIIFISFYLTCLKMLKLIIDIQTKVAKRK